VNVLADADAHPEEIAIALGALEAAMEEIEYPQLIKRILTEYIELCRPSQPEIETFLIADE
jgi:Na+-transporting NADH:ubiquinone oxidoreductase subunit NqrA